MQGYVFDKALRFFPRRAETHHNPRGCGGASPVERGFCERNGETRGQDPTVC